MKKFLSVTTLYKSQRHLLQQQKRSFMFTNLFKKQEKLLQNNSDVLVSSSFMRNIFKFFAKTTAFLTMMAFYLHNKQNQEKLQCDSNVESRYGKDNIADLENSINNKIEQDSNNKTDEMPDLPFEMMDDESMAEIQALMENPDADPEAYQQLMSQKMNVQPPAFKQFNQAYKCSSDDETWNGLKIQADYSPLQTFKFDIDATIEPSGNKSTKYSFVSMNPSKTDPAKGILFVGRCDPSFVHSTQIHANFSQHDRLSFVANFKKNDPNQSMFDLEYNKTLDRMNISAKYSNMGNSLACTVNAWKNVFLGVEGMMNPKTGEILYSYGINFRPHKKVGCSVMYLSYMPMISFDLLYMVRFYFTQDQSKPQSLFHFQ